MSELQVGDWVKIKEVIGHEYSELMVVKHVGVDGVLCEREYKGSVFIERFPEIWLEKAVTDPNTGMWIPKKQDQDAGVL